MNGPPFVKVKLDITETTVPTLFSVKSRDPLNRVFHDIPDIIISYVVLRYIKQSVILLGGLPLIAQSLFCSQVNYSQTYANSFALTWSQGSIIIKIQPEIRTFEYVGYWLLPYSIFFANSKLRLLYLFYTNHSFVHLIK